MYSRDPVCLSLLASSETTDLRATQKREKVKTFDAHSPRMECTVSSKSKVTALPDTPPPPGKDVGALYPCCIPSQIQLNHAVRGRKYYTSTLDNAGQYKTRFRSSLMTD